MKTVRLFTGEHAIVSDRDFTEVRRYKWSRKRNPCGTTYARTWVTDDNGRQRRVYLHRMITGAAPGTEVNHKDGNGLNCLRGNMEVVTPLLNRRGPRKKDLACSSRYRGVCWDKNNDKWIVAIRRRIGGKKIQYHLGRFRNENTAARAWNAAAIRFGFLPSALNKVAA